MSEPVYFPLPISDEPAAYGTKLPEGQMSSYGYHSWWCRNNGSDETGISVEDHGPICNSSFIGASVRPATFDQGGGYLSVDLVSPYTHGVYKAEDMKVVHHYDRRLRLIWSPTGNPDGDELDLHITSSEARSLAAALLRAADMDEFGKSSR